MASRYFEVYRRWQAEPEAFWADAAGAIDWFEPWSKVFDPDAGVYGRWFTGALCNTCYNALDRHVENGRGGQPALIYDSPLAGTRKSFTYAELKDEVEALAAVLIDLGIVKGDRVIIYMPMVPEAVFAMLACARIGAIHSVVFGGFAARELATRIDDAAPRLVVSASCGLEPGRIVAYKPLLDSAIAQARHRPEHCLILQRDAERCTLTAPRDLDYAAAVAAARQAGRRVPCAALAATDPLYVLYTSGTTGQPKGVVRDQGGHMVALTWSMANEFGVRPGETFWAASDVGWVVGHSYIVYGPLLHGATTILFEGKPVGTPDAGTYWRVIAEHGVVALFTAPTAFRAIKREDPAGALVPGYDLSRFRTLFLAGERADPETVKVGRAEARRAGHRSLVADGDRIADVAEPGRSRPAAGQIRLARRADAGLRHPDPRRRRPAAAGGQARQRRRQTAAAARLPADPVECRSAVPRRLSAEFPGLLQDRRCRLSSTTTATCSSWPAPTTSSMSPATGCRRAAWRRCWPSIRTSPNAP